MIADVVNALGEFGRAEGTIQPEHIHIPKRTHRCHQRFRIAAGEHVCAVIQIKARLHHQRDRPAGFFHCDARGVCGVFDTEQVLLRFDQQHIAAAGEQAAHLLEIAFEHFIPGHMAQADELRARADAADDVAGAVGCLESVAGAPRDLRCNFVDLERAIVQVGFGKNEFHPAKRVGLHAVATDFKKRLVDLLNHLRAGQVDYFADVFMSEPVPGEVKRASLEVGSHRAVEHNDTFTGKF